MSIRSLSAALLALMALSACQNAAPQQVARNPLTAQNTGIRANRVDVRVANPNLPVVPGEYVVRYRPGMAAQSRVQVLQSLNLTSLGTIGRPEMGFELVKAAEGLSAQSVMSALSQHPAVQFVEPNYVEGIGPEPAGQIPPRQARPAAFPNDEMFGQQYAHSVSNSLAGWEISKGDPNLILAVVDTGVDLKHPDLAAKLVPGWDAIDKNATPDDGHGHGTHCAGIAAALTNNGIGVAGFAPDVRVMPVRVLDNNGSGTSADVAAGIIWAADNGAKVISLSLGGGNSQIKEESVKYALSKDAVVVAAMGNRGDNSKTYPGAQPGVIGVGATDSQNKRASFSQYGDWISVSAPGVNILSTFPTAAGPANRRNYGSISGTSMATPAVAGVAALIRSVYPTLNREQVRAQIERGVDDLGDPGFDPYYGHGRINVAKALAAPRR
ncbi:MAG: S8 family peptidase [Candidatus Sericytochromatia bacterium]